MKSNRSILLIIVPIAFALASCEAELASFAPTPTFTPEEKRPAPTVTATTQPANQATDTPAALPVPSPFSISMLFTNGSCGTGTPTWDYTFTIDGTSITQDQTDGIGGPVVISLAGAYDPASGAFGTTADVGTGIETYDGTIGFDGTAITVTGSYAYTPTSGTACTFDFEGTTTP